MYALTRRTASAFCLVALVALGGPAIADGDRSFFSSRFPTILESLSRTDGAQALVAAVLVVDEAKILNFNLAELLGDKDAEIILLAPSNAAFESLLGLDEGFLNGLSIGEVQAALPGLLPTGVGAEQVAAILLKHAALPRRANRFNASVDALIRSGTFSAADNSTFPVGIGAVGVRVNYETTIIKGDNFVRNGAIHYIDTVIVDGLL